MFVFNTILIATHRRAGRHLTIDALRRNSPDICDSYMALEQIEPSHDSTIPLPKFRRQLINLEGRVLINVHDLPAGTYWRGMDERLFARTILRHSPTIYVHRDGRDVMVSLYYYMQSFSETVRKQSFAQFLRGDAAQDGNNADMSRPGYWALHAQAWLDKENLLAVGYHELETQYESTLRKMADFLSLRLHKNLQPVSFPAPTADEPLLETVLGRFGVRRLREKARGQLRVGGRGDWRRHFDQRDLDFFMREAGPMMQRLGYAS